jgi:hypothetical protein
MTPSDQLNIDPFLSLGQVAEIVGCARQSVYLACLRGVLPSQFIAQRYLVRQSHALTWKQNREAAALRRASNPRAVANV